METGEEGANDEHLAEELYAELRELARRELARERPDHTLQPTALVHEAYLRLSGAEGAKFQNRAHFYGAAAQAIRRVLVDHARARARHKRGGGAPPVRLDDLELAAPQRDEQLLQLDEALDRLASLDPSKARLVELRFFAGMTLDEAATLLGASPSTAARDWRTARAWLQSELDGHRPAASDADRDGG